MFLGLRPLMARAGATGTRTCSGAVGAIDQPAFLQSEQQPPEASSRCVVRDLLGRGFSELATCDCEAAGVLGYMPGNEGIEVLDCFVLALTGTDHPRSKAVRPASIRSKHQSKVK